MNLEVMLEAERRGILPPDKAALLAEARRRGLAPGGEPEKGFGQKAKEFLLGDDDPNTQNMGERIGTALNKAGEALTFGLVGDEASAAVESIVPGVNYADRRDHYRNQERVLERDNPGLALGADLGGAALGVAIPGGAIGTLARGASLPARIGASAAAGAGMGGTAGFMEGEGLEDRLSQAQTGGLLGAGVGAAIPVVGAGVQKIADTRTANRAIRNTVANAPTSDQLRASGQAAYRAIDDAGVMVRPDRVRGTMQGIADDIRSEGLKFDSLGSAMPASRAALGVADEVSQSTANSVPFSDLDMLRRAIGNASASNLANRNDTRVATQALSGLDDFVRNIGPDDIDSGDIETLQTMLPKARELWSRMSRSQLLDDAIEAGSNNYRTGAASGIRAQFQRVLNNPKLIRGFSDAEKAMIRRVVNGTLPEQALNYLGSGLGMITQGAVGAAVGGLPGMIAGAATGAGSRKLAERMVNKNAEIARAIVAAGGMPQLPVASDAARKITEGLMRRTTAAAPQ